jgi:hypothetical protein
MRPKPFVDVLHVHCKQMSVFMSLSTTYKEGRKQAGRIDGPERTAAPDTQCTLNLWASLHSLEWNLLGGRY